jgi:hypothetical protein
MLRVAIGKSCTPATATPFAVSTLSSWWEKPATAKPSPLLAKQRAAQVEPSQLSQLITPKLTLPSLASLFPNRRHLPTRHSSRSPTPTRRKRSRSRTPSLSPDSSRQQSSSISPRRASRSSSRSPSRSKSERSRTRSVSRRRSRSASRSRVRVRRPSRKSSRRSPSSNSRSRR